MPGVDTGDTAWVLVCAALVMFMTPGLAFFYGGLVRAKHVVGTIMQSFIALAVVTVLWVLVGYSLAFGPDKAGLIGGLDFVGLHGVGAAPSAYAPTIPATAFMVFQMMFAIITPALIAGAFAERMKFSGYLMLIALWSLFVYAPVAHWEWGGGFLGANGVGALDFAGGAVVHANAGAAALATAIYIGRRRGLGTDDMFPHNIPFVVLGAGILWFGWFGFNAGSALGANALASSAFVNTQLGAAAAVLTWIVLERVLTGKVTTIGAATGAVAGLATITPAAGYVEPLAALAIGLAAGLLCFWAVSLKSRLGYDDSLDVVGVHFTGGVVGTFLIGLLAVESMTGGPEGLFAGGGAALLGKQTVAIVAVGLYAFVVSYVLGTVVNKVVGFRLAPQSEHEGIDFAEHGETAYVEPLR